MVRQTRLIWTENGEKCFFRVTARRLERALKAAKARADNGYVELEDERDAMIADCITAENLVPVPGEAEYRAKWLYLQALYEEPTVSRSPAWHSELARLKAEMKQLRLDRRVWK